MHTGMLWFDNTQTDLSVRVNKAFDYYVKKYGVKPNLCLVNPTLLPDGKATVDTGKVTVRPYRPVLPNHIWIGIEDTE